MTTINDNTKLKMDTPNHDSREITVAELKRMFTESYACKILGELESKGYCVTEIEDFHVISDPAKFTPGPWRAFDNGTICADHTPGLIIATVHHELNRNVIAAAPEMYKLVQSLINNEATNQAERREIIDLLNKINNA